MGVIDKAVLLDVLPLSLGIETQGDLFTRIIPRNTPVPASESRVFTTATDNQISADIHVLQGERELAQDNISLGQFQLQGILPLARGIPKIEVAFDVDVDGIVHVSAKDLLSEEEVKIKIVSSKSLPPDDIKRLLEEAESFAQIDKERKERVIAGIQAENAIVAAEIALRETSSSATEDQAEKIERAVLKVKEALASGRSAEIASQSKDLRELLETIHKQLQYIVR